MYDIKKAITKSDFLALVRNRLENIIDRIECSFGSSINATGNRALQPEKMFRTIFAYRLLEHGVVSFGPDTLAYACAAAELVNSASLCHGNAIDKDFLRTGGAGYGATENLSRNVLLGDLFLNESILLLMTQYEKRYVAHFVEKVKEVFLTGIEHEIPLYDQRGVETTRMHNTGGTSGPVFGFIGYVCGEREGALAEALEEVGYMVGAAYQLYDEFLNATDDDTIMVQDLANDLNRQKMTLLTFYGNDISILNMKITALCDDALNRLRPWPQAKNGVEKFVECDLMPAFYQLHEGFNVFSEMK